MTAKSLKCVERNSDAEAAVLGRETCNSVLLHSQITCASESEASVVLGLTKAAGNDSALR